MKKTLLPFLVFLIILAFKAKSQIDLNQAPKNIVYFEGAGIGGYGSLNFERIVSKKKLFLLCARIGMSTYNFTDYTTKFNPDFIIPFAINGLYGTNHKIEVGIGQTISNIVYANPSDWKPDRATSMHSNFNIGYRYQNDKRGFMFRCCYSPIIEFNKYYRHWGGISIGYAF